MATPCPQCKGEGQVVQLPAFWKSLSQDAELKRELRQPPRYDIQWVPPLLLAGLTWLAFDAGHSGWGVLLLIAVVLTVGWVARSHRLAEAARDRWLRLLYCRRCPAQFLPEDAKTV